ncbi:MAG: hypothetical protein QHJ82_02455 [Verrucomicrobiota bacterium]|nr:hypothetical protein [Verrucomicrobiota bacterium]
MNKQTTMPKPVRAPTRYAPDAELEFASASRGQWRATIHEELERLKNRLLQEYFTKPVDLALAPAIRRAANEAAALASISPYPLLVFPTLFEEKAEAAVRYHFRQQLVWDRSRRLMSMAA